MEHFSERGVVFDTACGWRKTIVLLNIKLQPIIVLYVI